ncbi:MAG: IS200/IS605 family transposase [Deltaproteobacteria bacterium]|nr:IS200/IS605 family transposase [Deltaproteobacteria bacterium]
MSQSLASIKIHLIFSTKLRLPLLEADIRPDFYRYISAIAKRNGSEIFEIGGVEDHIHILLTLPKTTTLAKLVEVLKSSTSKWLKTKKESLNYFAWQTGYGAFSVSESQVPRVKKYIQEQQKHHQKSGFKEELIQFFRASKISFDEKYLWT